MTIQDFPCALPGGTIALMPGPGLTAGIFGLFPISTAGPLQPCWVAAVLSPQQWESGGSWCLAFGHWQHSVGTRQF